MTCALCKSKKRRSGFYRSRPSGNGLYSYCKTCCKKIDKKRNASRKRSAWRKAHYQKNKKAVSRYQKAWSKAWRKKNHAYVLSKERKYYRLSPKRRALCREKDRRRRHRWYGTSVVDFTINQWNKIKRICRYRCVYCGKKKKLTQDHVIPLSKKGNHTALNIVPACQSCNSSKMDGPPLPFKVAVDLKKAWRYS